MYAAIIAYLTIGSSPLNVSRYDFTQAHMGVRVDISLYAPDRAAAERAAQAAFDEIARIEAIASDYRPDSEAMRLCDRAGQGPVRVSPTLMNLLLRSEQFHYHSGGLFDVTAAPLVRLWRESRRTGALPTHEAVQAARRNVGMEAVRIEPDAGTVEIIRPGVRLDFGGIAKGYACDAAVQAMRSAGAPACLVEMGGDIALGDAPPGEAGWRVLLTTTGESVQLHNCGVSTSGDTEQFVEVGGRRYSHVVDLRTGLGSTQRVMATVIGPDATTTDALATALSAGGYAMKVRLRKAYPELDIRLRVGRDAPHSG